MKRRKAIHLNFCGFFPDFIAVVEIIKHFSGTVKLHADEDEAMGSRTNLNIIFFLLFCMEDFIPP